MSAVRMLHFLQRLMEIHSNPPKLYTMSLHLVNFTSEMLSAGNYLEIPLLKLKHHFQLISKVPHRMWHWRTALQQLEQTLPQRNRCQHSEDHPSQRDTDCWRCLRCRNQALPRRLGSHRTNWVRNRDNLRAPWDKRPPRPPGTGDGRRVCWWGSRLGRRGLIRSTHPRWIKCKEREQNAI